MLGIHFDRTITADAVDAGTEYLQDHNLVEDKPAESPPERPPATSTPPPQTPQAQNEAFPGGSVAVTDKAPGGNETPPNEPAKPPVEAQSAQSVTPLKIPDTVRPVPIAQIDECIRDGYSRNDIVDIMKHNFGRTYSEVVKQRLALWRQTHPTPSTASSTAPSTPPPATPQSPPGNRQSARQGTPPPHLPITENTRILGQREVTERSDVESSGEVGGDVPGGNGEVTGSVPEEFVAVRNSTDDQVIRSLRSEFATVA